MIFKRKSRTKPAKAKNLAGPVGFDPKRGRNHGSSSRKFEIFTAKKPRVQSCPSLNRSLYWNLNLTVPSVFRLCGFKSHTPRFCSFLAVLRQKFCFNSTDTLRLAPKRDQVHPITNTSSPIRTYCLTNVTLLLDLSKSTRTTSPEATLPDKISLASGVSISV